MRQRYDKTVTLTDASSQVLHRSNHPTPPAQTQNPVPIQVNEPEFIETAGQP